MQQIGCKYLLLFPNDWPLLLSVFISLTNCAIWPFCQHFDRLRTYNMALARLMSELERSGVGRPTRSPVIKFWSYTSRNFLCLVVKCTDIPQSEECIGLHLGCIVSPVL
jgi:hypothetical protein